MVLSLLLTCMMSTNAQTLNKYKYVVIQHQEDAPKDIEERMAKEFPLLDFVLLSDEEISQLSEQELSLVLKAEYLCRQSGQCLFKIKLINKDGVIEYEDEQVAAAGWFTRKNDRQSAIKKIFKQLKKQNYKFQPLTNDSITSEPICK